MADKAQELLDKARRKKAGWKPRELKDLYQLFGFDVREAKSSHRNVSHPKYKHLRATYPDHDAKELPEAYIVKAIRLIDSLLELEKGITKDD